jgi:hypothetical protein
VGTLLARAFSFVMPVLFLTVGSWGLLLAGLFVASLLRPLAVLPAFESLLLPWSAAVAVLAAAFFLWAPNRPTR